MKRREWSVVRGPLSVVGKGISRRAPRTADHGRRHAFTLVELLVVITIIGILAALIASAAINALRTARQAAIKVDVTEVSGAFERYKDKAGSYPPNAVTDDTDFVATTESATTPISEPEVLIDMRRHFSTAFQRSREPEDLVRVLVGAKAIVAPTSNFPKALNGGMTAAEATVFWLSGTSDDVSYPLSGQGGPSYEIPGFGDPNNRKADPIANRSWLHPFKVEQLGPRADDGFFDDTNGRYIEYKVKINNVDHYRRINFWTYTPARSKVPIIYFDVSRHPAAVKDSSGKVVGPYDPPAASELLGSNLELHVHALKTQSQSAAANVPVEFANQGKFQVLHCGIDDLWGDDILDRTSAHGVLEKGGDPANANSYLLFPSGPFTGDTADTVVNFIVPSRLEDAGN